MNKIISLNRIIPKRTIHDKRELLLSFVVTFLMGLAAHGYCYLNDIFSHDSMLIYQNDNDIKLKAGRFLTPIYREFRTPFTATWLIGILSLIWLSLAAYFLIKIFNMHNKLNIIATAGILVTNYSLTLINATYIHDADCYMASVFFVAWGAYLCVSHTFGFLPGGICFAISMGLYQANFPIALTVFLLYLIRMLLEDEQWKNIFVKAGQIMGSLITAFLFYKLGVWWFVQRMGLGIEGEYNSVANAFDFKGTGITWLLKKTLLYILDFFCQVNAYNIPRVRFATIVLAFISLATVVVMLCIKKISVFKKLCIILGFVMLPLMINCIYFVSSGLMDAFHHLMIYPFCMVYFANLFFVHYLVNSIAVRQDEEEKQQSCKSKCFGLLCFVSVLYAIILVNNITFANDIYLKKSLESKATLSLMTRIVDRMEQTDGYIPGETEVVLVGELMQESILKMQRPGLERYRYFTGQMGVFSITYYQTYEQYFNYILGYPINMMDMDKRDVYIEQNEVKDVVKSMSSFPAKDSIIIFDDKLIIKMSN